MSEFVDTNIFLRLISKDDPTRTARCLALVTRAEQGAAQLVTSEAIIAEVIYVLSSKALYGLGREEIASRVRPLIELRGLQIDHKGSILFALDLYEQSNLDFEDCLVLGHADRLRVTGIYSYDRGFDRVNTLRLEP